MIEVRVLKVFVGPDGRGGNPLGVVLDGSRVGSDRRQEDIGIGEDEATGAAAVMMGGLLGRPLEINQGVGSVLQVRPGPDGTVEVGGLVEIVGTREIADAIKSAA
jgi:predicted PhzF superfamily epimerase YddE/YHI9